MSKPKILLIVVLVGIVIGVSAAIAQLSSIYIVPNTGTVKSVGVSIYSDAGATQPLTSIYWGLVQAGSLTSKVMYVKNIRNTNCTLLLTVDAWNPTLASQYLTVAWNYTNTVLVPLAVVPIQVRLAVSSNVQNVNNFSFNMTITATEKT